MKKLNSIDIQNIPAKDDKDYSQSKGASIQNKNRSERAADIVNLPAEKTH